MWKKGFEKSTNAYICPLEYIASFFFVKNSNESVTSLAPKYLTHCNIIHTAKAAQQCNAIAFIAAATQKADNLQGSESHCLDNIT